jgi:glutathione synthase/RimK-type ligase-like ATP-grasp enzyme
MRPIAIHHREESFSGRWIQACRDRQIPYQIVDAYASDILPKLRNASAFLWHIGAIERDMLMGQFVLRSAEEMGLVVYPSQKTCWHFDDKVAQKYFLEAIGAPLAPTWVFYDRQQALDWVRTASFPKVFKIRRGCGSRNVQLIKTREEALAITKQAFGRGFRVSGIGVKDELWKFGSAARKKNLVPFLRSLPRKVRNRLAYDAQMGRERGYVYFQEFVPRNQYDTRITIIGDRAFSFTRNVRPNDFRASGSGRIEYDAQRVRPRCIEIAYDVARRIGSQSLAFDFVLDESERVVLLEISFGFQSEAVHDCPGYFTPDMRWVAGHVWPEHAILDDLLATLARRPNLGFASALSV